MAAPSKNLPPYSPYESTLSVIDQMAKTFIPQRLDADVMPSMSGGMRSNVLSGLRTLGLIDSVNHPTPAMDKLVDARKAGGDAWAKAIGELVRDKYEWALKDFDLARVTSKQMRERFHEVGGLDGSMLDRGIRFFLKALTDAKIEFSPHLKARKTRGAGSPRKAKTDANGAPPADKPAFGGGSAEQPPAVSGDLIDIPIPIAKAACYIRVPRSITKDQLPLVMATVGVVTAMANLNAGDASAN